MKIYIGAQFESRLRIRPYAEQLWHLGHTITSTWLQETARPPGMSHEEFMRKLAGKDLAEINAADLFIQDTIKMSTRGGASTECGFALGNWQSKRIWVVGPQLSPFHYLADKVFASWDDCVQYVKEHEQNGNPHAEQ